MTEHRADTGQVAADENVQHAAADELAEQQATDAAEQRAEHAAKQEMKMEQETETKQHSAQEQKLEPESAQTTSSEDSTAETDQAEVAPAQAELEALREQVEEFRQRWLRAQADFDNFRRRTRQEKEDLLKYASMGLIEQLLPVVDNFERAIAVSESNKDFDSLFKGLEMIYKQLMQVLEQEGLKPIDAVGQPFNPEYHQAVMQVESEEHEEGIIVEEMQKGYMLKEKVLRPSMVNVST